MADMKPVGGRIREHVQAIELFAASGLVRGAEESVLLPTLLPLGFDGGKRDGAGSLLRPPFLFALSGIGHARFHLKVPLRSPAAKPSATSAKIRRPASANSSPAKSG